jgi:hypothetical protein
LKELSVNGGKYYDIKMHIKEREIMVWNKKRKPVASCCAHGCEHSGFLKW